MFHHVDSLAMRVCVLTPSHVLHPVQVRIVAEAYRIRAVAFETPEETAQAEVTVDGAELSAKGGNVGDGDTIETTLTPPRKNDGALNFGRRRVGDATVERFTLRNRFDAIGF